MKKIKRLIYPIVSLIIFNIIVWAFGYEFDFTPSNSFGFYIIGSFFALFLSLGWVESCE